MNIATIILNAIEVAENPDKRSHYRSLGILDFNDNLTFVPIGHETFKERTLFEVQAFKKEASTFCLQWTDEYQKSRKTKGFICKAPIAYVKSVLRKSINADTVSRRRSPTFNRQNLSTLSIESQRKHDAGNGEFVKKAMSRSAIESYTGPQKTALISAKAHGVFQNTVREYRGEGRTHTPASNLKTEIKRSMLKEGRYINFDISASHFRENLKRMLAKQIKERTISDKSLFVRKLIASRDPYSLLLSTGQSNLSREEIKQIMVEIQNAKSDQHINNLDKQSGYILSNLIPDFISFCREIKGNVDLQYGYCSKKETAYMKVISQKVWDLGCSIKNEFDGGLVSLGDVPQEKVEAILTEAEKEFGIFIKVEAFTVEKPKGMTPEQIKKNIDDMFANLAEELGYASNKGESDLRLERSLNELDAIQKKE